MSKFLKILLIVLLTILVLGLTFVFSLLLNSKIDFEIFQSKLVYDEKIIEPFNNIEISTKSFDIKLVKSEDSNVNAKIYDKKDSDISVKVEDDTLIIENDEYMSNSFVCFGKSEIIISLPEKEYNLMVNNTSGDIKSKLNLNIVNVVTTSGDIFLNKVNDLEITSTSGDIVLNEVSNVTIISTSGDVEIGLINNSLNIKTTSGDIEIGDLTIMKDSNIKVTSGDVTIKKSSDNIYYNAKVTSGDIKINNNNRYADYELKIETKSGDIIIK